MDKKYLKLAIMALGFTTLGSACSGGDQQQQPAEEDTVAVAPEDQPAEEVDAPFSYKRETIERKFKTITASICADFAKDGNEQLVKNVNAYINKVLGGKYKADIKDAKEVLAFYANLQLDEMKEDWEEGTNCARDTKITFCNETENYISYTSDLYMYSGGAHGLANTDGASFRKTDGKPLSWDMFDTQCNEFKQIVKEGLKSYIEENSGEKIKSDDELHEYFPEVENINNIPLPKSKPYFSKKGLVVHYGQYEIASYAIGQPELVIPFSYAKKFIKEPGFLN